MDMLYPDLQQNFTQLHLSHCIEQLRQAILYHGDLTPVTLTPVYSEGSKVLNLLGQTEYERTCRDWRRFAVGWAGESEYYDLTNNTHRLTFHSIWKSTWNFLKCKSLAGYS